MYLHRRPMLVEDVPACVELMTGHPVARLRYGERVNRLAALWQQLLCGRLLSATVVESTQSDGRTLKAFSISTFVTDEFVHECKSPLAWMGPALMSALEQGNSPILAPKAVRDANSREGLNLMSWAATLRQQVTDRTGVLMQIVKSVVDDHRGYRIKEALSQPLEPGVLDLALNSGALLWNPRTDRYEKVAGVDSEAVIQHPFIIGADRQTATQYMSSVSALFHYTLPRIFFKPSEQNLLAAALRGARDEDLSRELQVSLSCIKKTWSAVYRRAAAVVPELQLLPGSASQRGPEKRRILLCYVREHPEELRPVAHIPALRAARSY